MSALPSVAARALAFAAIIIGGLSGAVIGYGVVKVQCTGDCARQEAVGAVIGALFIGVGIAIVAVLVLRAMGEWNAVKEREVGVVLGSRTTPSSSVVGPPAPSDDGPFPESDPTLTPEIHEP
jgi:hypothetical protein